jgi:hypothetical protein
LWASALSTLYGISTRRVRLCGNGRHVMPLVFDERHLIKDAARGPRGDELWRESRGRREAERVHVVGEVALGTGARRRRSRPRTAPASPPWSARRGSPAGPAGPRRRHPTGHVRSSLGRSCNDKEPLLLLLLLAASVDMSCGEVRFSSEQVLWRRRREEEERV